MLRCLLPFAPLFMLAALPALLPAELAAQAEATPYQNRAVVTLRNHRPVQRHVGTRSERFVVVVDRAVAPVVKRSSRRHYKGRR